MMDLRESRRAHDVHRWIARVSKVVGVPEHNLFQEFGDPLPIALYWKTAHPRAKNIACWRAALQATQGYPNMEKVLLFYATVHGCTTSNVERMHCLQNWLWAPRRRRLNIDRRNDELIICMEKNHQGDAALDETFIFDTARDIWKVCGYGCPRVHAKSRADKGVRRPRLGKTLTNWMRKFRTSMNANVRHHVFADLEVCTELAVGKVKQGQWCNKMMEELAFQSDKRRDAFLHALTYSRRVQGG